MQESDKKTMATTCTLKKQVYCKNDQYGERPNI